MPHWTLMMGHPPPMPSLYLMAGERRISWPLMVSASCVYGMDDDNRLLVRTMQEARAHGGVFTVPQLAQALGVSLTEARTVLARAENEGYARKEAPDPRADQDPDAQAAGEVVWTIRLPTTPTTPAGRGARPPQDAAT